MGTTARPQAVSEEEAEGAIGDELDWLRDVHVTEPVPVRHHPLDVWHGSLIARAIGVRTVDKPAELARYLTALGEAYDTWRISQEGVKKRRIRLRKQMLELLAEGVPFRDLCGRMQVDWPEIQIALTNAQDLSPLDKLTLDDWSEFERDVLHGNRPIRQFAIDHGLTYDSFYKTVRKMWPTPLRAKWKQEAA